MNESQKQVLADAFLLLRGSTRRGGRMLDEGATIAEVRWVVGEMQELLLRMQNSLDDAAGADAVIVLAEQRRRRESESV